MIIKIEHIANTFNYGSMMMAINLVKGIVQEHPNSELYVDADTNTDIERLKKATSFNDIKMAQKYNSKTKSKKNKLKRLLSAPFKLLDIKKNAEIDRNQYDVLLVIGGDDLSEYYGKISPIIEAFRYKIYSNKINTLLVGQTMGPFTSYRKRIIPKLLANTRIYTRDNKSYEYLVEELKMKNVISSKDLAFLDLPMQNDFKKEELFLKKRNLKNNEYITIVPSGLSRSYCSQKKLYFSKMTELISTLCDDERLKDKKIIIMAHVVKSGMSDDRNTINYIRNNLITEHKDRIIYITDELLPHEARYILGNGFFTITGRMHAAVSTFQCGRPAISLSYSVKYEGVIGKGLNMKELIIESSGDEYWKENYIVNEVISKIDYIFANRDEICCEISRNVSDSKKNVLNMINDINILLSGLAK